MSVDELLQEAAARGIDSLALTDVNNTSACLDFIRRAPAVGIRPVVGIDFRLGVQQLYVGLAQNNAGFLALNRFLSKHLHEGLPLPAEPEPLPGVTIIYAFDNIPNRPLRENEFVGIRPGQINKMRFSPWKLLPEKLVVLQPVSFRGKKDFNAHRLLRAIDLNALLSMLPKSAQASEDEQFLHPEELLDAFSDFPQIIENTRQILANCSIHFDYGKSKNKVAFTDSRENDILLLRELAEEGMYYRYSKPTEEVRLRLDKELGIIHQMNFSSYFLINWDLVRYARHKDYFYVGRGSGANSIVAYCLQITDVDPIDLDLYFERFINPSRVNPPDFDVDFSWKDRDDITRYIFKTHGQDHTALLATYSTFQYRSVLRELGKVFGLPKGEIDKLQNRQSGASNDLGRLVVKYSELIKGFPSHLSVHAGGILISEQPIHTYSATNLPPKGYPLTQFSMIEAEDIGLYKFDILSQRGLGKIKDTLQIVRENQPSAPPIDIHDIQRFKTDPAVKAHLKEGRCMGCFYVESPAMRMLLKKLRADNYLGLVAASSIIRPGVAKSGMMREYIVKFHEKPEERQYLHPKMKELMEETFGIMVYQEDVIKVAHFFAGLTLTEADILRRGMSWKFKQRNEFDLVKNKFFDNCKRFNYPLETTREVWRQIESFANFAFSKGHSASYAVESYQSLFLKAYYPLEFMVSVINNSGGFYSTEFYVHEVRMNGAIIEAPCVNNSQLITCIKGKHIYLGFALMQELEEKTALAMEQERRNNGPFQGLEDFTNRVPISLDHLRLLIRIGAFRFIGRTKKELLWDVHLLIGKEKKTQPKKDLFNVGVPNYQLPELHYAPHEDAFDEVEILGFSLSSPFELLEEIPEVNATAADFPQNNKQEVILIGYLVNVKNTATSKGETMHFGTFLDRDGHVFDTTHFPGIAHQFPFTGRGCYYLKGVVAEEFGFYSLDVKEMKRLPWVRPEGRDPHIHNRMESRKKAGN